MEPAPAGGKISLNGAFSPNSRGLFSSKTAIKLEDIRDGTSNTFAFGEISRSQIPDKYEPTRAGWAFGAQYSPSDQLQSLFVSKSIERELNKTDSPITSINTMVFSSNHPGGVQFALADGSVRYVKQSVNADILKAFASTNTREKPEELK